MDAGCKLLEQALVKDPQHIGVMTHIYNARKTDPQDPRYHEITRKLLSRLTLDNAHYKTAGKIFNEYTKLTKRPHLTADLYFKMSSILAGLGYPEKAERILAMLIKQKPDFPGLPSALLKLATGYRHKGVNLKYQKYLQIIDNRYPNSSESQIARRHLAKLSSA